MSCSTSDKITRSTSGIGASFEAECTADVRWLVIKVGVDFKSPSTLVADLWSKTGAGASRYAQNFVEFV